MSEKRYVLPVSETLSISGADADKLIKQRSGNAALLYIYILKNGGNLSFEEASAVLGRTETQLDDDMRCLASIGLVTYKGVKNAPSPKHPVKEEPSGYTAADVAREMENGADFKCLVQEVQRMLGKILSSDDLIRFFGIYDSFGLPPEVIMQLVSHCINECSKKSGSHRIPTMRYIEKAASTWEQEGIFTIEDAEKYLKRLDGIKSKRSTIKSALGIKDRELTLSESKYIDCWINAGFGPDAAEIAYDRTVLKTGKLSWGYMNSIMKNWHEKGLHTSEEITKGDLKAPAFKSHTAGSGGQAGAKATTDMEQMKRLLKKLGGD